MLVRLERYPSPANRWHSPLARAINHHARCVACRTKRNQILFSIIAGLAAEFLVVDFEAGHLPHDDVIARHDINIDSLEQEPI